MSKYKNENKKSLLFSFKYNTILKLKKSKISPEKKPSKKFEMFSPLKNININLIPIKNPSLSI
jgi:hypothetical protein